jgi:hypothetical protein
MRYLVNGNGFCSATFDEPVKSQKRDSFVKRSSSRRANLSGVRRTYVRRSDIEMQRNAEIGLFTELSLLNTDNPPDLRP